MQKDIFQQIPDFDQWLENKSFDELNISEKEMILQHLTPEAYEEYRNAFFMLKSGLKQQNLKPDERRKTALMHAFDQKYNKKSDSRIMQIINYKIPLYQTGIAAALILAFVLFFNNPSEKIKYVNTTDTIYVEKPIYTEVVKNQEITKERKALQKTVAKQSGKKIKHDEKPNYYKENLANNILSKMQTVQEMKRGKNIGKDSMLLAWIVPVR